MVRINAAVVAFGLLQASEGRRHNATLAGPEVVPELDPESDSRFFKNDYPSDRSPGVEHRFSHPYPTVQDSEDYEKDFVNDQNSDNGEWAAQMEYDKIKNTLRQQRQDANKAKDAMDEQEEQLKEAEERLKEAENRAKRADEKVETTKVNAKEAQKDLDEVIHTNDNPDVDTVPEATANVEKAVANLKMCEKDLAAARERLKQLMDEKDKALDELKAAQAELAAAKSQLNAAKIHQKNMEAKVAEKQTAYEKAVAALAKEQAELDALLGDLKSAEATLRQFRSQQVDQDGGVYRKTTQAPPKAPQQQAPPPPPPRSATSRQGLSALAALALFSAIAA